MSSLRKRGGIVLFVYFVTFSMVYVLFYPFSLFFCYREREEYRKAVPSVIRAVRIYDSVVNTFLRGSVTKPNYFLVHNFNNLSFVTFSEDVVR